MAEVTDRTHEVRSRAFRPYPEYRDSGADWLGKIPVGWQLTKLKHVAAVQASSVDKSRQENQVHVRFLGTDTVYNVTEIRNDLTLETASVNTKEMHDYSLHEGDVVLTKDSVVPTRIADVSIVAEPVENLVCGYHLTMIRPDLSRVLPRYIFWYLGCSAMNGFFLSESRGTTIIGLSSSSIRGARILRPPIGEQRAIADFLDRETAKIDALVARKERLIELLREKRTALITRAVTRGLDPNVPMKDSGVEWLGEIPAHWEVMPLKRILRRCDYGISESLGGSGDIRVLTMAHVQDGEIVLPDDGSIDAVDQTLVLESGDLLFNRTNSRELVAKVGIFRGDRQDQVTFASYLVRLTARDNVEVEWLNYLLNSTGLLGMARSMALLSVNQANLNPTKYQRIVVPMPELSEQRRIAGSAKHEATRIDTLVRKIRKAIDQLKEFRTALISAAVTGKIDVREAAAR